MYKDTTLFFSQDNVVTIAHVVPTMDHIDVMLSNSATKLLNLAVKHALLFAHKLMDKYYSKTDLSNVYCIAMGPSPLYLH
jgi:L-ascorbate metabolism protein UlaG (beta-lactamase superfamily)